MTNLLTRCGTEKSLNVTKEAPGRMSRGSGDVSKQQKTPGAFQRLINAAGNVFFGLLLLVIISMVFFLVQNKMTGGVPKVFGHYMYVVLSGSMAPTFDTGSLVFVKPKEPEEVKAGDVITYHGVDDKGTLATHRVMEVDNTDPQNIQFITKGDANEVTDPSPVSGDRLVGTLSFSIPYLGYLLSFAQTKKGMLLLIIIPGTFLIITELHKLYTITRQGKEEKEAVEETPEAIVRIQSEPDEDYEIVELTKEAGRPEPDPSQEKEGENPETHGTASKAQVNTDAGREVPDTEAEPEESLKAAERAGLREERLSEPRSTREREEEFNRKFWTN